MIILHLVILSRVLIVLVFVLLLVVLVLKVIGYTSDVDASPPAGERTVI